MTSIRESLAALEQAESLQKATLANYKATVGDIHDSVLDLNAKLTRQHRDVLDGVRTRIAAARTEQDVERARQLLRDELSDYQRQGLKVIADLKDNIASMSHMLEEMVVTVGNNTDHHTAGMVREVTHLQQLAASNDLDQIRTGLKTSIAGLTAAIDDMKRQTRATVAQYQDEIRTLHKRLKDAQTQGGEPAGQAHGPQEPGWKIDGNTPPFGLMALWIANWKHATRNWPGSVKTDAINRLTRQLGVVLGYIPPIVRRQEDVLLVRLDVAQPAALTISKRIGGERWTDFEEVSAGEKYAMAFRVRAGLVYSRAGEDPNILFKRFDQIVDSIKGSG